VKEDLSSGEALERFQSLLGTVQALIRENRGANDSTFIKWKRDCEAAITRVYGTASPWLSDFRGIEFPADFFSPASEGRSLHDCLRKAEAILESMKEEAQKDVWREEEQARGENFKETERARLPSTPDSTANRGSRNAPSVSTTSAVDKLVKLLTRFHIVVSQLANRAQGGQVITINDEYDVHFLLRALLRVEFDDVRSEEPAPSHAGGSSRLDFLIKQEGLGIEVKRVRPSMSDKVLGDQLIEDIARHAAHPDCKTLVLFVYDPDFLLRNPAGLKRDLSGVKHGIEIVVCIQPEMGM